MEFLSNDLANMKEPTEAELKNYFEKHSDKYMLPFTFSLYQIVFTNEKHTNPNAVIAAILAEKDNLSIDNMNTKGDNLPFPYVMKNITGTELASQLGSEFAKALQTIELNTWVGPVQSGFGKHIVYITDREVPTLPLFEAARAEVLRDYQYDRQNELNKAIYDELRKNYNITITIEDGNFDPEIKTYLENQLKK